MRKNCLTKINLFIIVLTFVFGMFAAFSSKNVVFAETNTDSEYVNTVTDVKTTDLLGSATLYEQKMSSLLNGDSGKAFQEHFVQWVDMDTYDEGIKLVSWTMQSADDWKQATTEQCAINWEKYHPGWIVVAGINGDFFNNSGTCTFEPTNNFMQDGEMYRADATYNYRKVLGIKDDHTYIAGDPEISGLKLQIMNGDNVAEQFNFNGYNVQPTGDGLYLLTKDKVKAYDLTGYTVYVGKYDICRISNGSKETVFVKGTIESSREGTENETPKQTRDNVAVREFYIVTKDASFKEKLTEDTYVRCQHVYEGAWSDVTQSCGVVYQMLVNGKSQFQNSTDSFTYTNHPRTFIGFKEDGTPVLMVVDGRGAKDTDKNNGVSLFQGAELMKLAGCVNAFNLDGGGSSTLIVRNETGGFDIINRPSDGTQTGIVYETQADKDRGARATGNAFFLVMRDPGFTAYKKDATTSTVTFNKKTDEIFQNMEDVKITIDGITKELPAGETSLTFDGLKPATKYSAVIKYKLDGEECASSIHVETKEYNPYINVIPNSYGFTITRYNPDPILKTISVDVKVDDTVYKMGDVDKFVINDLMKDTPYTVSYSYTVQNSTTNETFVVNGPTLELSTLSYELPAITKLEEGRKADDSLRVSYAYTDADGLVKKAYIYLNDTKYELTKKSGSYTFEDLDFANNTYNIKIVLIYEIDEVEEELESDLLTYEKPACTHDYDNDCDATCNLCGATREVAAHKWVDATCTKAKHCSVCGIEEGTTLEHTKVVDKGYAATCEKEGLTDGSHCSVCNKVLEEQKEIKKADHTWVDATKKAPKTCSVCGTTEGEKLKGCKKASVVTILSMVSLLATSLVLLRKKR